jgi:hypothetical protein
MRRAYAEICAGEDPWIALGNFLHQFFGQYKDRREDLVRDPLDVPALPSADQFRWAVFCAASVEHLCKTYALPCPQWALTPGFSLDSPWYIGIGADLPRVQQKLRSTTPRAFAERKIFCGDRTFRNKYEWQGRRRTA